MRLQEEGHRLVLGIQRANEDIRASAAFQAVGRNLVGREPLADLLSRRDELRYWVWNGDHSVRENELLRSEGFRVFGGGLFPDLEQSIS
jgi:hypothetical protein